jgi:hypothetical protein
MSGAAIVPGSSEVVAINLIPVRPGVSVDDFVRFSATLDQPSCLAQDVVQSFDAYRITGGRIDATAFDVLEVMRVRSWPEWVRVRDGLDELRPVTTRFDELVDSLAVRTLFGTRITREHGR